MTHNDDEPIKGQQLPPFAQPERKRKAKEPKPRPSLHHSRKRVARPDEDIIAALPEACANETAAVEFIEMMRWGGTPVCPRCASPKVAQMKDASGKRSARYLWRCYECKAAKRAEQFTVRVGSVFEDSRLPMRVWTTAMWMTAKAKNGCSALELSRATHRTHKTCLFVLHRLRWAMATDWSPEPKMEGNIVADETYLGPKTRQRVHARRSRQGGNTTDWTKKRAVLAVINQQTGEVRTRTVERVTAKTLTMHLLETVDPRASRLLTDKEPAYITTGRTFALGHHRVDHSVKEYVRHDGDVCVTTNPCEAFFSRLKRALVGTFHSVSVKHAHRYASEFEFKSNTAKMSDGARFTALVKRAVGKRLTYAEQIGA